MMNDNQTIQNKTVSLDVLEKIILDKIKLEQKFLEDSETITNTYHITGKIDLCRELLELIRGFRQSLTI